MDLTWLSRTIANNIQRCNCAATGTLLGSGRDCPTVCPIYNMAPLLDRFWPPRRDRRSRVVDRERQLARLPEFKEAADNVCHKHANASHPLALLRARRERPCDRRAAQQRDELAPPHSITPFARAT